MGALVAWKLLWWSGTRLFERAVDHRVGQPADAAHQRQAAVLEAVHLREAAGLEERRHQRHVARAEHLVRQRLVVADGDADRLRRGSRALPEGFLQPGLA